METFLAYAANSDGVAHVSAVVDGFSLTGTQPVLGRAVVFHNGAGDRVGCGIIRAFNGEIVTLSKYVTYTGTQNIHGMLAVSSYGLNSLTVTGSIAGLQADATGDAGTSTLATRAMLAIALLAGTTICRMVSIRGWVSNTFPTRRASLTSTTSTSRAIPYTAFNRS